MRSKSIIKIGLAIGVLVLWACCAYALENESALQQEAVPSAPKAILFEGQINADNINVRADSTTTSKIICTLNRSDPIDVVKEMYDWYKIRLPKSSPAFIKKDFVEIIDDKTAKVIKDNVNIRLMPNESSIILGRASKNEVVTIIDERVDWYKIEPISNTFGWVHKQFVSKAVKKEKSEELKTTEQKNKEQEITAEEIAGNKIVTIEGTINPYGRVFRRNATHKLITTDKKAFLLKGNKDNLDSLNYHKVKVTGKLATSENKKYPATIEIQKIESLD